MKIFRELLQLVGIIVAVVGIVIAMCDCNSLELQFRSMIVGLITFLIGALLTYIGNQLPESVNV